MSRARRPTAADDAAVQSADVDNGPHSVIDSPLRRVYFDRFRSVLGRHLVGDVLHELRNPLNAVSLNADMLAMVLAQPFSPAALPKLQQRAAAIKERLLELGRRQNAFAELWLADPLKRVADRLLAPRPAIERAARLVRDQLSSSEIMLAVEMDNAFDPPTLPIDPIGFDLIVAATLLCCAASRSATRGGGVVLRLTPTYDAVSGSLSLALDCPLDFDGLAAELGIEDVASAVAAFSALSATHVELRTSATGVVLRFLSAIGSDAETG